MIQGVHRLEPCYDADVMFRGTAAEKDRHSCFHNEEKVRNGSANIVLRQSLVEVTNLAKLAGCLLHKPVPAAASFTM